MKTPVVRPGAVYELARPLVHLPADLKLRNVDWGLLCAVTGKHTVTQIGDHFGLPPKERDDAFARLAATGLIVEREVTFDEYLSAVATIRDDQPKTLAQFLRSGAALGPSATSGAVGKKPEAAAQRPDEAAPAARSRPPRPATTAKLQPSAPASHDASLDEPVTRAVPILGPVDFEPLAGPPNTATTSPTSAATARRSEPRPAKAPPANTQPANSQPANSQPTTSQPTTTQPAETRSAAAPARTGPGVLGAGTLQTAPATAHRLPTAARPSKTRPATTQQATARQAATRQTTAQRATTQQASPQQAELRPASAQATHNNRRLSLQALMHFIINRAPDPTAGQLDIYRVFIRVDTQMLKRNGITTLRFSEDHLIDDPDLQQAIASSVRKTIGAPCPSEVFV